MFIVLEGLDGAGKSTQIRMLKELFARRGVACRYLHFPRFDAPVYGELIARFLRGELGLWTVDPYLVALLFAGDRGDAARCCGSWLDAGDAVVLDRYVYSNVGFQCAKLPAGDRPERSNAGFSIRSTAITESRVPTCRCFWTFPFRSPSAN